jgi:hypothetical protein
VCCEPSIVGTYIRVDQLLFVFAVAIFGPYSLPPAKGYYPNMEHLALLGVPFDDPPKPLKYHTQVIEVVLKRPTNNENVLVHQVSCIGMAPIEWIL